ncbi:hypothetical protein DERF_000502 [Dermatophagoides farinae]|uniref:Uncharacterized protein n=1 Tax=Dermatophagoides farinae TaxID=6954 RepID=A0A922L8C9_DERFA|nr:hypothetical protein DERF_000502 [Dermatophagoides farinae]
MKMFGNLINLISSSSNNNNANSFEPTFRILFGFYLISSSSSSSAITNQMFGESKNPPFIS